MDTLFSPRSRSERLVAIGRIVLAASSLVALWRDPSEPAKYAGIAYSLLAAYLGYALALAALASRSVSISRQFGWISHAFDLAFFSAFMYFTSGPASPFIAYFVFALVSGTLRWQWRGALWTAIVCLGAYFSLGFYFFLVVPDPTLEPNEFIIRGVYMAVVAFLLGHLGRHEKKTRDELGLLSAWPVHREADLAELTAAVAGHAARIHEVQAVALAWTETTAEARSHRAVWRDGKLEWWPAGGGEGGLVHPELEQMGFIAARRMAGSFEVLARDGTELRRWHGEPVAADLLAITEPRATMVSAPWRGDLAQGRIFLLGARTATSDDLLLVEITAALIGAQIDSHLLLESRRESAAVEERIRLARDLHDGVLQSFTGIGLRIATVRRQLEMASEEASRGLDELQQLVAFEQRDLRFLIQELKPVAGGLRDFDLAVRLAELVQRVEQEWEAELQLEMEEVDEELSDQAERDLYFIVREAVINAARHGQARQIRVRLGRNTGSGGIELTIADDGKGFPFTGRFDQTELESMKRGPRSLRERVVSRRGTLILESSDEGSRLAIEIPA